MQVIVFTIANWASGAFNVEYATLPAFTLVPLSRLSMLVLLRQERYGM